MSTLYIPEREGISDVYYNGYASGSENRIFKLTSSGVLSVVFSTSSIMTDVALDGSGNLYYSDLHNVYRNTGATNSTQCMHHSLSLVG